MPYLNFISLNVIIIIVKGECMRNIKFFLFMFLILFLEIISVNADTTCKYDDGNGNKGQLDYKKTDSGYDITNIYAEYNGRKADQILDTDGKAKQNYEEYFKKNECPPTVLIFLQGEGDWGGTKQGIVLGDASITNKYELWFAEWDTDGDDTWYFIPLLKSREEELKDFSDMLNGYTINIETFLESDECKDGAQTKSCVTDFRKILSQSEKVKEKYDRLVNLRLINGSDKEVNIYINYINLMKKVQELYPIVINEIDHEEKKNYDCYYVSSDETKSAGYKFKQDVYVVRGTSSIDGKDQNFPIKTNLGSGNETDGCYKYLYYVVDLVTELAPGPMGGSTKSLVYHSYLGNDAEYLMNNYGERNCTHCFTGDVQESNLLTLVDYEFLESENIANSCSIVLKDFKDKKYDYNKFINTRFSLFEYSDKRYRICIYGFKTSCSDYFEKTANSIEIGLPTNITELQNVTFKFKNDKGSNLFSCSNFNTKKLKLTQSGNDYIFELKNSYEQDYDMDLSGCIIDPGTKEIIDWIMNLVRVGGIILLIVLGMLDFIKAAASGEAEQMKKSKDHFVKRLIACVALFLAPILVDLILSLVNIAGGASEDCNSKVETSSNNNSQGGSQTHESSSGREHGGGGRDF